MKPITYRTVANSVLLATNGRFVARATVAGVTRYVGRYDTLAEAVAARDLARAEMRKPYAAEDDEPEPREVEAAATSLRLPPPEPRPETFRRAPETPKEFCDRMRRLWRRNEAWTLIAGRGR